MKQLTVSLVAPSVWEAERARTGTRLSETGRRVMDATVRALHDQHVGIPFQTAAQLAPLFQGAGARVQGPWAAVVARLTGELNGSSGAARSGLVFHHVPAYGLLRLAIPLVEAACRRLGECLLFSDDPAIKGVSAADYQRYAAALDQTLTALAEEDDPAWRMFWRHRALALSGLAGPARDHHDLPEMDDAALAMLLRLNPLGALSKARSRRLQPETAGRRLRDVHMLKEGGIDGIRLTHRVEEMDRMTPSEFINHKTMFADRLINSGYFAYRRRPKAEARNDAVFAALLPGGVWPRARMDFLKSCWFSLAARLAELLSAGGLGRSAFSWTEGDAHGRVRTKAFPLHQAPAGGRGSRRDLFKRTFMTSLGWLPFLLDERDRFQDVGVDHGDASDGLPEWAAAAWRFARAALAAPAGFAYTHVMVFLPVEGDRRGSAPLDLVRRLGSGGMRLGVTLVPQRFDDWEAYTYMDESGRLPIFHQPPESMEAAAEAVLRAWLNPLVAELWRV